METTPKQMGPHQTHIRLFTSSEVELMETLIYRYKLHDHHRTLFTSSEVELMETSRVTTDCSVPSSPFYFFGS